MGTKRRTSEVGIGARLAWTVIVALALAAQAGCASSTTGTSGETHFQLCDDTPECEEELGEGFVCVQESPDVQGRCREVFVPGDTAAGAGGTGGDGPMAGGEPASSFTLRSLGGLCQNDDECEDGLSCLSPANATVTYCSRACGMPSSTSDPACADYDGPGQAICIANDPMDPAAGGTCAIQCVDYGLLPTVACPDCDGTCPSGLTCSQTMFALNAGGPDTPIGGRCSGFDDGPLADNPGPDALLGQEANGCLVHFVLDRSGSLMVDGRFDVLRSALLELLLPGDVEASLSVFPVESGAAVSCDLADYVAPVVPLGAPPDEFDAALSSLVPLSIASPKELALEAAHEYARITAPGRGGLVILLTDDTPPGGCTDSTVEQAAFVASEALANDGARTAVIALGANADVLAPIALAGGTTPVPPGIVMPDDVVTLVRSALAECEGTAP